MPEGSFEAVRDREIATVAYRAEWNRTGWALDLDSSVHGAEHFVAADAFDALLAARERWEADGWRFLVNGARENAWPSGMSRDNGGLVVYLLDEQDASSGHPAAMAQTFGPCAADLVSTVGDQRQHQERFFGGAERQP